MNSLMKTVLRVHDGKGDRHSGASTACISPTAALWWHGVLEVVVDGADSDH
jgi:hypothetical protein